MEQQQQIKESEANYLLSLDKELRELSFSELDQIMAQLLEQYKELQIDYKSYINAKEIQYGKANQSGNRG